MITREWLENELERISAALSRHSFIQVSWALGPPAKEKQIKKVEKKLKSKIPNHFREILLSVASNCHFAWYANEDFSGFSVQGCRDICYGGFGWDIDELVDMNAGRADIDEDEYIRTVFGKNNLAVHFSGNGDFFAISENPENLDEVTYRSHDTEDIHRYVVALDISDFLRRFLPIYAPGPEHWNWECFTNNHTTMIDPNCAAAMELKNQIE